MSTSFQSSPEKRPTEPQRPTEPKLTLIRDPAAFTLATHSAGLTESEAQAMLDRSRLFPDAVAVKAAFRDMTPANIFAALEAEAEFVRTIQEARDSGPAPTAPWDVRYTHHHAIVVPKAFTAWTPLLNRLSELRVPPQLIEAFRQTEVEGLTR